MRRLRLAVIIFEVLLLLQHLPAQHPRRATADTIESHLGKGYDALKQESYAVAVAQFQAALSIDPHLALRARFPLAVALFESHQAVQARHELDAVRREVGDHPNILYYLGRLDLEQRDFPNAVANLKQAAAQPPFPDTAYYLGFAYLQQSSLTEAEAWLKQAALATPQDARVLYQLAQVYRKEGREADARDALQRSEEIRKHGNRQSELRQECGQKLEQAPREEAHALCNQLYDAQDVANLTALGTIYAQHGDLEAALKPLQRAAELEPESPQNQYNLALLNFQMNHLKEAREPLARALERWPDLFPLNALYGAVLARMEDTPAAYPVLLHAHLLNPQDKTTEDLLFLATLQLGRKSQESGHNAKALQYFSEASKLRPQEASPHEGMADIYVLTQRPSQAASEKRTAERLRKIVPAK